MRKLYSFCSILLILLGATIPLVAQQKTLTLDDIFASGKFRGKTVHGIHWMNDGKRFSYLDQDTAAKATGIFICDAETGARSAAIAPADLKQNPDDPMFRFTSYQWSPDESSVLFISAPPDKQYLSRLTPAGNLFLFTLKNKKFQRYTNVPEPQYNVKFSPDGQRIGLVRGNNIYALDLITRAEKQLTTDGADHIINGRLDWVYEEEFGISDGWCWSPDGERIAFWRLDENRVPEYTMTEWDSLYPKLIPMRYPKPGQRNSIVKIGVVSLSSGSVTWMNVGENDDIYIPRMQWTLDPNTIAIRRLNRAQNTVELLYADVQTGTAKIILTEKEESWLNIEKQQLTFLPKNRFLWSSERDGYHHLYLYKNDGALINQVTQGKWQIENYYGVDTKNDMVYFTSTEVSPLERHVYKIRLDGKKKQQLTKEPGTHTPTFARNFAAFTDSYSNEATPTRIVAIDNDGKRLAMIEENAMPVLRDYALAVPTFLQFETSDGVMLDAEILRPADFDSSKKYPVLMYAYGGPGSQVVQRRWGGNSTLWYSLLAQKGYIIFMLDNRGSGGRGKTFEQIGYKKLGTYEVDDQIEGAKYLASLSYVDKSRIGIWGWSYGGYTSAMAIMRGADYFSTSVSVAPVTDWRFYDNIYTERFMGTPAENPEGYANASVMKYADRLKGNFLLIHGTSDDNVHFQNTVNLVSALEQSKKQFRTMFYPNKNHGIAGGNTTMHLYTMITSFLLEKL